MTPLQFSDIVRPLVSPTSSVATPWVFSQDRGCCQCPVLGLSFLYSGNTACFLHPGLRHQIYNCLPTNETVPRQKVHGQKVQRRKVHDKRFTTEGSRQKVHDIRFTD